MKERYSITGDTRCLYRALSTKASRATSPGLATSSFTIVVTPVLMATLVARSMLPWCRTVPSMLVNVTYANMMNIHAMYTNHDGHLSQKLTYPPCDQTPSKRPIRYKKWIPNTWHFVEYFDEVLVLKRVYLGGVF